MSGFKARLQTRKDTYTIDYPHLIELARQQANLIWFAEESGVEKDEQDVRVKLTDGERHGLQTVLKLFTKYELMLGGDEFWGGKINRMFPRPEVQRLSATNSYVELGIHAPFYDLINKTLNINTDEFYDSWKEEKVLRDRIEAIASYAESDDPFRVTASFAFMEGVVLFSNFAFLKSFSTNGLIPHVVAGIDASAKDENYHSVASASLFRILCSEYEQAGEQPPGGHEQLASDVIEVARTTYEHEAQIVDLIFEKGGIRGITKEEILCVVRNRIDVVLGYLGYSPLFGDEDGVVSKWFYNQISTFKHSDFFNATQFQYTRNIAVHELFFRTDLALEYPL